MLCEPGCGGGEGSLGKTTPSARLLTLFLSLGIEKKIMFTLKNRPQAPVSLSLFCFHLELGHSRCGREPLQALPPASPKGTQHSLESLSSDEAGGTVVRRQGPPHRRGQPRERWRGTQGAELVWALRD